MEHKVRRERNKILQDIKTCSRSIQLNEEAANRFLHQEDTEYNRGQLQKLRSLVESKKQDLDELNVRLTRLEKGLLDSELVEQAQKDTLETHRKRDEVSRKKQEKKERKLENKAKADAYWKSSVAASREARSLRKGMEGSYRHFLSASDTVPSYIQKSLKKMPNNKGYIWRSVHFYGYLPAEEGKPVSMFENCSGGILRIHEWTEKEYRLYERKGGGGGGNKNKNNKKGRKELIYSYPRRKRALPFFLN